jgi:hypothetical protein
MTGPAAGVGVGVVVGAAVGVGAGVVVVQPLTATARVNTAKITNIEIAFNGFIVICLAYNIILNAIVVSYFY